MVGQEQEELNKSKDINSDEVGEFIVTEVTKGRSFKDISDDLKQREFDVTPQQVSALNKTYRGKVLVRHTDAREMLDKYDNIVEDIYKQAIDILGRYVRKMREMLDLMESDEDKMAVIKTIPLATNLIKEIRETMKFQADTKNQDIKSMEKEYRTTQQILDDVMAYDTSKVEV